MLRSLPLLLLVPQSCAFRALPRRGFLLAGLSSVLPASADTGLGYVDDAGASSYSQVQRAWEKSSTMSDVDKFLAGRGASKPPDLSIESPKKQKRRAMAGCSWAAFREEAGYGRDEAACNARVMDGDVSFMLDIMNAQE